MTGNKKYWIAFCVGTNDETNKVLASCLTFWATNRFYALEAVRTMLPEHENWTRSDGSPVPHMLWKLEQCTEEEAEERAAFYIQTFFEVVADGPSVPGMVV